MKTRLFLMLAIFSFLNVYPKEGDTLVVQCFSFKDASPDGWQAYYQGVFDFPDDNRSWSKILMVKTLKCDSTTAADKYPCGEWDYITQTQIYMSKADSFEIFEIASFVTPYGKGLYLGRDGWEWEKEVSDYAPLLKGKRTIVSGNNQELLDLKFLFIEGMPAREVLTVENIWTKGNYRYEYLATDSILKTREIALNPEADSYKVKARISGHGHKGPRNCCEWDSKTHSYYIDQWNHFRWEVWKNCGDNPIFPQGGTWQFDRAGWCPGTFVDEYDFALDAYVQSGDTISFDYGIEMFRENGEKEGKFRMSHQLFSYGEKKYIYDAEIIEVLNPNNKSRYRRNSMNFQYISLVIRNNGSLPLNTCDVYYSSTSGFEGIYTWSGNLAFGETETVNIYDENLSKLISGEKFSIYLSQPNGKEDENNINNEYHTIVPITKLLPGDFVLRFETNDKGRAKETYWFIQDDKGKLIKHSGFHLSDDSVYTEQFNLIKGYYKLVIYDLAEDGMIKHWWLHGSEPENVGKNGRIEILDKQGEILLKLPYDFAEYLNVSFRVE